MLRASVFSAEDVVAAVHPIAAYPVGDPLSQCVLNGSLFAGEFTAHGAGFLVMFFQQGGLVRGSENLIAGSNGQGEPPKRLDCHEGYWDNATCQVR